MSIDIESEIEITTENLQCTDKLVIASADNSVLPTSCLLLSNGDENEPSQDGTTQSLLQLNTLDIDSILNLLSESNIFNQPNSAGTIHIRDHISDVSTEDQVSEENSTVNDGKRSDELDQNTDIKFIPEDSPLKRGPIYPGKWGLICQLCNIDFETREELNQHMGLNHLSDEGKFLCPICKHGCWQLGNLKRHMKIHDKHLNIKPYACEICGHKTTCKSYLKKHMRRHTGEKPYHCQHCEYKSATWICLKRHETRHTGVKPFQCGICGFGAVQRQGLNVHMKKHETGRLPPYNNSFSNQSTTNISRKKQKL